MASLCRARLQPCRKAKTETALAAGAVELGVAQILGTGGGAPRPPHPAFHRMYCGNTFSGNYSQWRRIEVNFAGSLMKTKSYFRTAVLAAGLFLIAVPAQLAAQTPGRVEFSARVA